MHVTSLFIILSWLVLWVWGVFRVENKRRKPSNILFNDDSFVQKTVTKKYMYGWQELCHLQRWLEVQNRKWFTVILQPFYSALALQICPDRITSSVYAIFYIQINRLNYLHGLFPSVKAQINKDAQFRGQGTEKSFSSSSSGRISSNSTVIPKIPLQFFSKTSGTSYLLGTGRVWNT